MATQSVLPLNQASMTPNQAAAVLHGLAELTEALPADHVLLTIDVQIADTPPNKPSRSKK